MKPAAMPIHEPYTRRGGVLELHRGMTFGEVSNDPQPVLSSIQSKGSGFGTELAISNLPLGVPVLSHRTLCRGGPRNLRNRESHGLTAAQIANLIAAEAYARQTGRPFTRFISVHWEAAGVPLPDMVRATGRFLDLMTKTIARHGGQTAWVWVHENGPGKGGHAHLLVHVPGDLVAVLTRLQRSWIKRITGKTYRARVLHSRPIGARVGQERTNPAVHAVNLATTLAYVLKGATPSAAATLCLGRREPGGLVIGKRCGASQNIGAGARKRESR
jgi:hypothetical protein